MQNQIQKQVYAIRTSAAAGIPCFGYIADCDSEHTHLREHIGKHRREEFLAQRCVDTLLGIRSHIESHSAPWFYDIVLLQVVECFQDCVSIYSHLQCELTHRGHTVAFLPLSSYNPGKAIIDNLPVYGSLGIEVHSFTFQLTSYLPVSDLTESHPPEEQCDSTQKNTEHNKFGRYLGHDLIHDEVFVSHGGLIRQTIYESI